METVKIAKNEYKRLVSKAKAYDKLAKSFFEGIVEDPVEIVVKDFKKTGIIRMILLRTLKRG